MPKKNSPALNLRDEANFFVCDVLVPKDDMASMEHPIFSLSTKADTKIRHYEHNGNSIKITPSVMGLATIHDKDILIYCISQIVARIKEGQKASRTVRLKIKKSRPKGRGLHPKFFGQVLASAAFNFGLTESLITHNQQLKLNTQPIKEYAS